MENRNVIYAVVVAFLLMAYVGSTARADKRWPKEHLRDLRRNKHGNKLLQEAFNRYGEDSIYYEPIETVDDPAWLPGREAYWIAELKKLNAALNSYVSGNPGSRGKKLSKETRRRQSVAKTGKNHPDNRKDFAFISPEGKRFTPHGLNDFCKENGLSVSAMSKIWNLKQDVHRGWKRGTA
jgi:hypothetical protein